MALQSKILKLPAPSDSDENLDTTLCDLRFRALLPDDDWGRLPLATWRRFSKRLADGKTAVYVCAVDRRAAADVRRHQCPQHCNRDRRCCDGWPGLDPYLRAPERFSSGHSLIETFLGTDGS